MTSTKTLLAAAAVFAVAVAPATFANAQAAKGKGKPAAAAPAPVAAAPAPAAQPPLQLGPALPGVCLFSQDRAVGGSMAGQAANQRMGQLRAQVTAELGPERTALEADAKAYQAAAPSLPQDQQQQKVQGLQKRYQDLEAKAALRQRELEVTGQKALQRIAGELEPIVRGVIQARACSILLNADSAIYAANPAMDVTPAVVDQLNTKMSTITFDREHIDPAAAQQR
jgi:outer membrane protein